MLGNLVYFIFIHLSLLIPGYVVASRVTFLKKKPHLILCLGYVISIVFYALLATIRYIFDTPMLITSALFWFVVLTTSFMFITKKYYLRLYGERFVLLSFVLLSLFSLIFVNLSFSKPYKIIPDPSPVQSRNYQVLNVKVLNLAQTNANDNYLPYRHAQFFVNRSDPAKDSFLNEWGVHFFQRTPLLGAVTANFFNVLNDRPPVDYSWAVNSRDLDNTYGKFQIIAQILNVLFVIPGYFIIVKLFNKKTAATTLCFIATSQYFLYNSFFSWPKSFVAFFILLSWILLMEKTFRFSVIAGLVSGIAYLTHDLAVLYIGASFVLLLFHRRFKDALTYTLATTLLMIPWALLSAIIYKRPSSFIYYPISLHDIPQPSQKRQILHEFIHTSPLKIIWIRINNFLYIISPYQLFTSEGGQDIARRTWALGLYSIPGAVGFGLFVPTVLGAIRKLAKADFWILAVSPIVLSTVAIGWPKGLAALHFAEASTLLFIGLAVALLNSLKHKIWILLAFAVNLSQLIFFVLYSYGFTHMRWFSAWRDGVSLIILLAITSFFAWILYSFSYRKGTLPRLLGV